MSDGELRRSPQPWESGLAGRVRNSTPGLDGWATGSVGDEVAQSASRYDEPEDLAVIEDGAVPSTPVVSGTTDGLVVAWDGLDSLGDDWPGAGHVQVHVSTTSGFTPSSSTRRGRLDEAGEVIVGGLVGSTTYYVKLLGRDETGEDLGVSAQVSQVTASFDPAELSPEIVIDQELGTQGGGAGSWGLHFKKPGSLSTTDAFIAHTASNVSGSTSGRNGVLNIAAGRVNITALDSNSPNMFGAVIIDSPSPVSGLGGYIQTRVQLNVDGGLVNASSGATLGLAQRFSGDTYAPGLTAVRAAVRMRGVVENTTTQSANMFISNAQDTATKAPGTDDRLGRVLMVSSTARIKDDIQPLTSEPDVTGIPEEKLSLETASADPHDVLNIVPVEFKSLAEADEGRRFLGFIAEQVAESFPWGAVWDPDGQPGAVADRPILAALLAVVKEQQGAISALEARVAALEGAVE